MVRASLTPHGPGSAAPAIEGRREARLRPEAEHVYPSIPAGEWQPAAILADRVMAGRILSGRGAVVWRRALDEAHFEFRGGGARRGERGLA